MTVDYFISVINDFEDAYDTKNDYRAIHKKRNFKTIDETNDYIMKCVGLTLKNKDVVELLNLNSKYIEMFNLIDDDAYDELYIKNLDDFFNKISIISECYKNEFNRSIECENIEKFVFKKFK